MLYLKIIYVYFFYMVYFYFLFYIILLFICIKIYILNGEIFIDIQFLVGCEDRNVYFWDIILGVVFLVKEIEVYSVCQIKFDKDFLYIVFYDNIVVLWNMEIG